MYNLLDNIKDNPINGEVNILTMKDKFNKHTTLELFKLIYPKEIYDRLYNRILFLAVMYRWFNNGFLSVPIYIYVTDINDNIVNMFNVAIEADRYYKKYMQDYDRVRPLIHIYNRRSKRLYSLDILLILDNFYNGIDNFINNNEIIKLKYFNILNFREILMKGYINEFGDIY